MMVEQNSNLSTNCLTKLAKLGITSNFYALVPKTPIEHLRYRRRVLELCYGSEEYTKEAWIMCRRDPLFFINTFCWTYDPRLVPRSTVIPFNTFPFQDEAVYELIWAVYDGHDLLIEKSRDEGASWVVLLVYTWFWLFYDNQSFRLLSRTEDLVDKTDSDDCLFWKIDFLLEHLPDFMRPPYERAHLKLRNNHNGSFIHGFSTTGDAGRGGRCTSLFPDEFPAIPDGFDVLKATRDMTRSRIFNGTPKGTGTAQYALKKGGIRILRFHWSQDPRKNKGLYTSKDGQLQILNSDYNDTVKVNNVEYQFPTDYPFICDGKVRSPWYDNECSRAAHPMEIAQELDIDYLASDFQFFDDAEMNRIEKETARTPYFIGEFNFDADTLEFISLTDNEKGRLKLWTHPDVFGKIASNLDVVVGYDVSAGTGASNSVAKGVDKKTHEDVFEWTCPHTMPEDFAKVAVALAKYFNNAYMIWDAGGPGSSFGKKIVQEIKYSNVYYRTDEATITRKVSDKPGYFFTGPHKRDTLTFLRDALKTGDYVARSYEFVRECREYVHFMANNSVEHAPSQNTVDPSGAGDNHGDRVIASALAYKGVKVFTVEEKKAETPVPTNCYHSFKKVSLARQLQEAYW